MKMRPVRTAFGLVFLLAAAGRAQVPVDVRLCDLVKEPQKYSDKLVRVRGQVSLAFEDFSLRPADCGEGRSIWLAYGGDEPTPTISSVNDQERKSGSVLRVHGMPVPLQRDASLELFRRRLAAQRLARPDGSSCYDRECYLYDVTATLTGVFAAAQDRFPRYGHLGCCHLLVIEQVASVDARRTEVPAGGRFTCSTETWEMSAAQAQQAFAAAAGQLQLVASHWADHIDGPQVTARPYADVPSWQSGDLLRKYTLRFEQQGRGHRRGVLTGAVASREVCRPETAPYPMATPIGCTELYSRFPVNRADAKSLGRTEAWRIGDERRVSRQALDEGAKHWGVALAPDLKLNACSEPMVVEGNQSTSCSWSDPGSMQQLGVDLTRFGFLRHWRSWNGVPWILEWAGGIVCVAEGEPRSSLPY